MSVNTLPPAIFLMGPTASGKTALAIEIAQHLPCDLISVDSALVYRGLNIGSAKPSAQEQALAPHRLIDIRDPQDAYSAAEFRQDALIAMAEITAKGRIPLLVGGTMMYFKALYDGIADMPTTDLSIRADIEAQAAMSGWPAMHQQLSVIDPDSASRIHPNHSQRIERALNVYRSSGQTMTELYRQQGDSVFPYQVIPLAIAPLDRGVLHQRIEKRFRQMMEQGLVDEVRALHSDKRLHLDLPSMRAVGYRQVWDYLDGRLSYDEMIERGIIATRQLAKRQFTWLRSWPNVLYLYTDAKNCLTAVPESVYVNKDDVKQLEGEAPIKLALKYLSKISHSI